jgi:general nucleoside transport system ATP-binding protein
MHKVDAGLYRGRAVDQGTLIAGWFFMANVSTSYRLQLQGICKRYPSVMANQDVQLSVKPGEIHAVLGENGAGKSTLMKMIYGITQPDEGVILWEGREVRITSPAQARALGIGMVFQHFALFESLTVAENISLSMDQPQTMAWITHAIVEVSARYGLPVEPDRPIHSMSVGERQRVEIVRCLMQSPQLLIMDEPTSVLTPQAVVKLFETLRRLAQEGCSILYISHKLDEVRELCSSATVLRAGRCTGLVDPRSCTNGELARLMIGQDLQETTTVTRQPGEVRLCVKNLSQITEDPFGTSLEGVNLEVRGGEILGIAGISGNGQAELLRAISGEHLSVSADTIQIEGESVGRSGPAQRRQRGMTFVPEERLGRGAAPGMSLKWNALLTGAAQGMVQWGWVKPARARDLAQRVIERFKVMCSGVDASASSLSGGNLQKFIVGREVLLGPRVMVLSQPTWGVDVGAAQLIHQALMDLRAQGVAVLVVSEELDELFALCDRLAVMNRGRLSEPQPVQNVTRESIGILMAAASDVSASA